MLYSWGLCRRGAMSVNLRGAVGVLYVHVYFVYAHTFTQNTYMAHVSVSVGYKHVVSILACMLVCVNLLVFELCNRRAAVEKQQQQRQQTPCVWETKTRHTGTVPVLPAAPCCTGAAPCRFGPPCSCIQVCLCMPSSV
jgi:hypothetical protein